MIYIGIPVHNERHTIGPLLWRIRELLYGERREFHVLVCDDASDDDTRAALERYPRVLPMTLLRSEERRGYAASVERLVRATVERSAYPKRDALVTMQGDFTDPPESLSEMLRRFEGGADLVTVARTGAEDRPRALTRLGARLLARPLAPPAEVTDPFASMRLYRLFLLARALSDGPPRETLLAHDGWAANAELLLRVWPHLRRHEEVAPVPSPERRYRGSRFRATDQLRGLIRAGRDPEVRASGRAAREAA